MKRLFLFNEGSRASKYGIGKYIEQLINCLVGNTYISLNVVCFNSGEKELVIESHDGYMLYLFPNSRYEMNLERTYKNAWYLFLLNVQINSDDELIFHLNYSSEYPFVDLIRNTYQNCKIIFTIHYQYWCFALCGNLEIFQSSILSNVDILEDVEMQLLSKEFEIEKKLYENVDIIICLSHFTEQIVRDIYQISKDKIYLVYNGIDDVYDKISINGKNMLNSSKNIIFVGRLDEIKGISVLIESFKELIKICPDCHLYIIGEGDFSKYLKLCNPIWDKITFTGFLEEKELYQMYNCADVGLCYPNMSNVVLWLLR